MGTLNNIKLLDISLYFFVLMPHLSVSFMPDFVLGVAYLGIYYEEMLSKSIMESRMTTLEQRIYAYE